MYPPGLFLWLLASFESSLLRRCTFCPSSGYSLVFGHGLPCYSFARSLDSVGTSGLYLNRTILEVYVASLSLKTHALHFSGELPAEREL